MTPGECVRELVLAAFGKPVAGKPAEKPAAEATLAEQTVLSEVLALRTILINLIYDLAAGHAIAPERMRELIAKGEARVSEAGGRDLLRLRRDVRGVVRRWLTIRA